VHSPTAQPPDQQPLGLPVYRTSAFAFRTAQEFADLLNDRRPGYSYSRLDNPTADAFASAVAALEAPAGVGSVLGQPFASGMAAISTVLLTLCRAGSHVVLQRTVYGGTYGLLAHVLARFDVQSDYVEVNDTEQLRAAMRPDTSLVWAETLANPTMAIADLPAVANTAHAAGVPLVVDSTFATPAVCRPLEHGADLVVHSATKYIGGHSDATGGVVVGGAELVRRVRAARIDLGGSLAPDEAFLLHRGLATLPLRMHRLCASAMAFAQAMAAHPRVKRVDYPGLPEHPDHALAERLFDRGPDGTLCGAVVSLTVTGGWAAAAGLCDRLQLAQLASSLGGTHTKVSPVATTTHRQLDEAALATAGIDPGMVRFSIGLEDPADLVADVADALDALPD
jgi:cystathionine beta-lyase/cystathionine gamma-synthase